MSITEIKLSFLQVVVKIIICNKIELLENIPEE
jgi:hypothetical protein